MLVKYEIMLGVCSHVVFVQQEHCNR